ncbi:MAG: hypothetical protein HZB51_00055 [Chloroflexi bacterium]|nr:hypothetical protein [Chloroflexota bacterium]
MTNLSSQLGQLETAQLVRRLAEPDLTYIFKHALVQDTAYEMLLKNRRRDIHRRVAEIYEQLYADQSDEFAAVLSNHYWSGEVWERAANFAILAGTGALRVFAIREALGHFERALQSLKQLPAPSSLQEYEALIGWANAAFGYRHYDEQMEHLARAEKIAREWNDKPRLARSLYEIGRVHAAQGRYGRAIPVLVECFTLADALSDDRYKILPTFVMGMTTLDVDLQQAIGYFEQAIELAQRYEDMDIEAQAWNAKAIVHARRGEFAASQAAIAHGQALIDQVKSPKAVSDFYLFAGWAFWEMGDAQTGLVCSKRSVELAQASDNMDCLCGAFDCVGFNQLAGQQLTYAADAFQEAIRRSQISGAKSFENLGRGGLAIAEFQSGRSQALHDLEQAYAEAQSTDLPMNAALMALALGEIYADMSDWVRSEARLNQALDFFRRNQMTPYLARALESLARTYEHQGETTQAEQARAEADRLTHELRQARGLLVAESA